MTTAKPHSNASALGAAVAAAPTPPATTMPSIESIIIDKPLYEQIPITTTAADTRHVWALRYGSFQFDAHCLSCGQASPFKSVSPNYSPEVSQAVKAGSFSRTVECQRHGHAYSFHFVITTRILRKVGQWPSMEDIAGADIEKYRHQLKDHFGELRKATGLASHGIGIGAFVYLRRIFERIIYRHASEQNPPIEGFDGMRMDEKVAALRSVLPPAVYKHRSAYAILSKGLHELDEDTCKRYFPFVRQAIIAMLEQDWVAREAKKADDALEAEFQKISSELGAKAGTPTEA